MDALVRIGDTHPTVFRWFADIITAEFKSRLTEDLASQLDLYGAVSNRQSSDVINSRFNSYRLHQRVVPVNIARLTDVIGWPVPAGLGPSLFITRIQMD